MTLDYKTAYDIKVKELLVADRVNERLRIDNMHYKLALQAQGRGIERLRKRTYRIGALNGRVREFESLIRKYYNETPQMPIFTSDGSIDTTRAATKLWALGKGFWPNTKPAEVERGRSYGQFGL